MHKSRLTIAATLVAIAGSVVGAVPAGADTSDAHKLSVANAARAQYGAPPMTWNSGLSSDTQQYAAACKFQHSDSRGRYGENLYAGTGNRSFEDAMKSWMAEASKYDYNNPGFSPETGHFTQVVWKASTQLTVGIASCPAGTIFSQPSTYIVARYTPPGNVRGQFPQNVGRPQN
ncbi:CAP family protein [Nocardia suismassiliense]|uniref:CAP family protein n=1 Tax=Nocardia suismassiliense TaxID=2077092 RepID=A0ABW6R0W7_9NOCA